MTLSACEAMIDRCRITPGDHVFVHGGTDGVGHIAHQTCGDETIKCNYREATAANDVVRLTDGCGFDAAIRCDRRFRTRHRLCQARVDGPTAIIASQYGTDLSPMHIGSLTLHAILMLIRMPNSIDPQHPGQGSRSDEGRGSSSHCWKNAPSGSTTSRPPTANGTQGPQSASRHKHHTRQGTFGRS